MSEQISIKDLFLNICKRVLEDENLAKYISILFYHHEYDLTHEDVFLEHEDEILEIDKILSTVGLEEHTAIALSNRYLIGLFFISYSAAFEAMNYCYDQGDIPKKDVEKETLKKLNDPSITNIFDAISSGSFLEKIDFKSKNRFKNREINLIKNYTEKLKNINLSVSKLEEENEQLKQRIEKGKKIWDDNKKLKEENEKLKLIIKKLGVNEPLIVRSSTDKDLPVQGQDTSSSQSGNIPVPDSNPMMTELSIPSRNNIDHTRSYAHTFRERGRFGSHPSHDDFGDESTP